MLKKFLKSITSIGLLICLVSPSINATDIYVPFPQKEEVDQTEEIYFRDLNLKEAILEYYKFHIDKEYRDDKITKGMMSKFTTLYLPWANIFSLEGLENAVNLKNLNLANNFIEDITPISKITTLEDLNINNNKIKDANSLSKLTNLKKLSIRKNIITNLEFLNNIPVEELDISYNGILKNSIAEEVDLSKIRTLKITGLGIENINFLKTATKLESLFAEENKIKDLSPIANLTNLRMLFLDKNNIDDLSALKNLEKLAELSLAKNNVTDITSLEHKNELYRLILDGNKSLSNISILSTATNLSSLSISDTIVSDISSLNNLKYIFYVSLINTNVSKDSQDNFREYNEDYKKTQNIDKKVEIVGNTVGKYFTIKNY
ncbi:leucine-rich repeat domain-containing protein, partial [Gemella sp. GH3]|uniref:leucine-rich repeat domain-containing protein n=1 Tax=unclassified Gemella TaxID=2624949 RepID=UPI0015D06D15